MVIDLDVVPAHERADVEREIATRVRAEDGAFGSTTLGDLISSARVHSKTVIERDGVSVHGVLIDWPGYDEPQVLPVSEALWRAIRLPRIDPPRGARRP